MPSILITGANGQLGKCFKSVSHEFPKYNLIFSDQGNVDITIPKTLQIFFETHHFDGIINCAAYTEVDQAENEKERVYKINVDGIRNLIDIAEKNDIFLLNFSTDYIFSGRLSSPYKEDQEANPINIYGESKYRAEQLMQKANCINTTFRISWLFSPFGNNFVKKILKSSEINQTIKVVNDQWGKPCYGIDLARVILKNIFLSSFFEHKCYHYAQKGTITWFDFAKKIVAIKEKSCEITPCSTNQQPARAQRPKYGVLDTSLIERHLSLSPATWENALKRCLNKIK